MIFDKVAEFHKVFGLYMSDVYALPEAFVRDLRVKLLQEEYNEYIKAEEEHDLIEIADGLADMMYIIGGTLVSYGIKEDWDFQNPTLQNPTLPPAHMREHRIQAMKNDMQAYLAAENRNNLDLISASLKVLVCTIYSTADLYGIPLMEVFLEVHRSNMSKLTLDGRVLRRADGKVIKPDTYSPADIHKVLFGK